MVRLSMRCVGLFLIQQAVSYYRYKHKGAFMASGQGLTSNNSSQPVWAELQTKVKSNNYSSEIVTNGRKGCRCWV